ncbi:hypothetical protein Hanom_Chr00s119028g01810931 [Helianthus anomalus]
MCWCFVRYHNSRFLMILTTHLGKKTRSGASQQVVEKPHRSPIAKSIKDSKTHKRSTTVKNYIPLSDGKLTLRLALKHMGELVESFNENQRQAVRNIGFGSILGFIMGPIPSTLGWWLVNNYDPKTRVLNCGRHHIQITEELVNNVFVVPRGDENIRRLREQGQIFMRLWRNGKNNLKTLLQV